MDFDTWLKLVNAELAAQGKKFSTVAIDPKTLKAAFDAGQLPDDFARSASPSSPTVSKPKVGVMGDLRKVGSVDYNMLGFLNTSLKGLAWFLWVAAAIVFVLGLIILFRGGTTEPSSMVDMGRTSESRRTSLLIASATIFGSTTLTAVSMFFLGAISMLAAQLIPLAVSAHAKVVD